MAVHPAAKGMKSGGRHPRAASITLTRFVSGDRGVRKDGMDATLVDDLAAEQAVVDDLVRNLDEERWPVALRLRGRAEPYRRNRKRIRACGRAP